MEMKSSKQRPIASEDRIKDRPFHSKKNHTVATPMNRVGALSVGEKIWV